MANSNGRSTLGQLSGIVAGIVLMCLVATTAWGLNKIIENGERISANVPPEWLVERLDRLENKLDAIGDKIGGD